MTFTYPGSFTEKDADGKIIRHTDIKEEVVIPVDGFPIRPYPAATEWAGKGYMDINKVRTFKLPKSGQVVTYTILDGEGEARIQHIKERSSHTAIQARRPTVQFLSGSGNPTPMALNLDSLSLKDIEALRKDMEAQEGDIDTVVVLSHPKAELVDPEYRTMKVDLTQEVAFFFPSQAT